MNSFGIVCHASGECLGCYKHIERKQLDDKKLRAGIEIEVIVSAKLFKIIMAARRVSFT